MILIKGLTPTPYKLVTIVSGLLGYNFPLFVAFVDRDARGAVLHGRGGLRWFGEPLRAAMERNFAAVLGGFAALVMVGFVIAIEGLLMRDRRAARSLSYPRKRASGRARRIRMPSTTLSLPRGSGPRFRGGGSGLSATFEQFFR